MGRIGGWIYDRTVMNCSELRKLIETSILV